jgi:NAD(P)-dependent dehydrogenase (short-subunit alcohol dehydrogenase family)
MSAEIRGPAELFDLTGRTALVTGASSGLGARFARVLATVGATVWITARRKERLDELAASHPALHALPADVSAEADRESLVAAVVAESGAIDVLVNNAGTDSGAAPLDETSARFAEVLGTNLVGPFHLAQLAARAKGEHGLSVVNISSILGLVSAAPLGGASYAAAKAGLLGLTNVIALEGAPHGILANTVLPFGMSRMVAETTGDSDALTDNVFFRSIRPETVAPIVVHLARRDCRVTHHNFSACAGRFARVFVGLGRGWLAEPGTTPTAEDIESHLTEITAAEPFTIPGSTYDEVFEIGARLEQEA